MTEGSSQRDRSTSLSRDDRIHGSLLIINELIMNSAWSDEVCCTTLYIREGLVYGKGRQDACVRSFGKGRQVNMYIAVAVTCTIIASPIPTFV